ncbi:CBS domain-containing protein [Actinomadura sp. NPDC048394]|uniref:CBS domain-containing protein n=1 Tax=Actinomadura sp. NPDC048394 TaxID=3158223 RepID=UPI0033F777D6
MTVLPPELENAAAEPVDLTVAELLDLFGERNRDPEIVGRIESVLSEAGLSCVPSLIHGHLDSSLTVQAADAAGGTPDTGGTEEAPAPKALRIGDLPTARLPEGALVSLRPDDDLPRARMKMLENHYSQLPVLTGPYVLKGVVSWQSIALAHAKGKCETLADAMDEARIVRADAELLVTIPEINEYNCVFVRDEDEKISGVVTPADLSLEFGRLTGPFLRLGEIERRLRHCVNRMCTTTAELREASGNNKAKIADDLTVWQIQQVFAKPDRWARLTWELHQDEFVAKLDEVRKIRNEVAHFRPNPLTDDQVHRVEIFASLLKHFMP